MDALEYAYGRRSENGYGYGEPTGSGMSFKLTSLLADTSGDGILQLPSDIVEYGGHMTHVRDGEDGIEKPTLPSVALADSRKEAIAEHEVCLTTMAKSVNPRPMVRCKDSRGELEWLLIDVLILHDDARQCKRVKYVELPSL